MGRVVASACDPSPTESISASVSPKVFHLLRNRGLPTLSFNCHTVGRSTNSSPYFYFKWGRLTACFLPPKAWGCLCWEKHPPHYALVRKWQLNTSLYRTYYSWFFFFFDFQTDLGMFNSQILNCRVLALPSTKTTGVAAFYSTWVVVSSGWW